MSILIGSALSKRFGPLDVFQGVEVRIEKGDRIGLVGPNGEGKTTLLRILAGLDAPTDGTLSRMRGLTIGYLPQDPPLPGDVTLWDDVAAEFQPLRRQAEALHRLEERMAHPATYEEALAEYGPRQAAFEAAGGYAWELRMKQVLTGLGFAPDEHHMPLAHLSGGQRTRGLLARLILQQPDLLLMDEPTNHLDLHATEWLEQTLLQWHGSLLAVSHDRYFLDRVATRVWELAGQRLENYRGNYSAYVLQREERRERQRKEWQRQQQFIAKEEDFIRRNIAGQNTKQAQGRRTRLERLAAEDGLIEQPRNTHSIRLQMETRQRSGNIVLRTLDLAVGYRAAAAPPAQREDISGGHEYLAARTPILPDDTLLFYSEDLELKRGERAALLGPNGAGKSTFLKTLLGQTPPLQGRMRVGAGVQIGYLAQAHAELRPEITVLEAILAKAPRMDIGEARGLLGRFLFSGDDVFKPISVLSGGQRSRIALARLTLEGANLLVLDEPTNHLDITSQEVLETVLQGFGGSVLLVTHDRYLVDAVATQVWMIDQGELRAYPGNYSAYLAAAAAESAAAASNGTSAVALPSEAQLHRERARDERRLRKQAEARAAEADRLAAHIETLEARLTELGDALNAASTAQDATRIERLGREYHDADLQLHQVMEAWAELAA
ncbi:MAG: ribosomal protection-like ABC-F family protein [Caldilineales bacterium]